MTDFFKDLRADLMEAAERDARAGGWVALKRLRVPWRPVLAVAGAAAAAALFLTVAATLSTDAERDVAPAASVPALAGSCAAGAIPAEVRESFAIFGRERTAQDELPRRAVHVRGVLVHGDEARRAASIRGGAVYLVPATGCAPAESGELSGPGVCVYAQVENPRNDLLACERVKETIDRRARFIEVGPEGRRLMVKAVPDHVERVAFTDGRVEGSVKAHDNVLLAELPREARPERLVLELALAGEAGPDTAKPVEKCGAPPHSAEEGELPTSLWNAFGVLRTPELRDPPEVVKRGNPQVVRYYDDGVHFARSVGGRDVYVVAAEIVARREIKPDVCSAPAEGEPGLCLNAGDRGGHMVACYLPDEIAAGEAFMDTAKLSAGEGTIVGLAPDKAMTAVVEGGGKRTELPVEMNVFAGPVGMKPAEVPKARVTFR